MNAPRVNVTHEWGVLKEVALGRIDSLVAPAMWELDENTLQVAPQELLEQIEDWAGQPWSEAAPEMSARAVEQMETVATLLTDRGVVVHRPTLPTEAELDFSSSYTAAVSQPFARDPFAIAGHHIVETAIRVAARDRDRFGWRSMLQQFAAEGRDFRWVSMPVSRPRTWKDTVGVDYNEPHLAGGDFFVFGDDLLIGWSGNDTTQAGIDWARSYFSDFGYRVHDIQISQGFLHLDDGLACIDEGLAIVCADQFTYGMPELIKGWDQIEVSTFEAKDLLGGNGMVLGPREIVIDSRLDRVRTELEKRNVTVHSVDYDAVTVWAGGLRCSHHPIIRELG